MVLTILRIHRFIDLNDQSTMGHTLAFARERMAHERWSHDLCPTDGLRLLVRVPDVCQPVPRALQSPTFLLLGPVSLPGLRPNHLPGEPAGHRGLPPRAQPKLYHMGFRGKVARSTLADANETRDWRIYADFAQGLIATARHAVRDGGLRRRTGAGRLCLDSTMIDLCLALFPWATFRKRKAAVKLHTLLDLRGNIPTFLFITPGRVHDINMLDQSPSRPGPSTSWTAGYSTSPGSTASTRPMASSSRAPSGTSASGTSIPGPSTAPPGSTPTRRSGSMASTASKRLPRTAAPDPLLRPRSASGSCSSPTTSRSRP